MHLSTEQERTRATRLCILGLVKLCFVNKYVLKTLQQEVGVNMSKNRYHDLKKFLENHSMNISDKAALDDALAWADKSSKEKQSREEISYIESKGFPNNCK